MYVPSDMNPTATVMPTCSWKDFSACTFACRFLWNSEKHQTNNPKQVLSYHIVTGTSPFGSCTLLWLFRMTLYCNRCMNEWVGEGAWLDCRTVGSLTSRNLILIYNTPLNTHIKSSIYALTSLQELGDVLKCTAEIDYFVKLWRSVSCSPLFL